LTFYFSDNVKMDCRSTKGTLIIPDENEKEEEDFIDTVDMYDDNVPISCNTSLKKKTTPNIKNINVIKKFIN